MLFFDGMCVLCNTCADFVMRHDRSGLLRLAALQGLTAARLVPAEAHAASSGAGADTVLLWDRGRVFRKSDAVLRAVSRLGGLFRLAQMFALVPRPVRDSLYDFVARRRLRWFGRRAACRVPSAADRERLLP